MNSFCGLDFGTSNSTIGGSLNNQCQLLPLEKNKLSIRSAIFCDNELKEWVFGQSGINNYLEGVPGRLMMAIKSILGTSLMDDKTVVFNELIPYSKILSNFMHHIKATAEKSLNNELTQVVLGRPVRFHDHDQSKDLLAEKTLEQIARDIGFKEVSFQYEPIAAAMTYELSITKEQLALIVDMGGGTSDFTVIRLKPGQKSVNRSQDVLANCGIHIAGTDFDQRLSLHSVMPLLGMGSQMKGSSSDIEVPSMFFYDLTTWHTLNNLYDVKTLNQIRSMQTMCYQKDLIARLLRVLQNREGHHILEAVETSKQRLSEENQVILDLSFIENNLETCLLRTLLNEVIEDQMQRIILKIKETISIAGIKPADINAIFYTGGSTKIPIIRDQINSLLPSAEVVQGDAFGSVGLGLAIEAQRKYQ